MDTIALIAAHCREKKIPFELDAPLRDHCSFHIGGPASLLAEPGSEEEIGWLAGLAEERGVPLLVLGKGSNVLCSDKGFAGLALVLGPRFARMELREDGVLFCQSGASLSALCRFALEQGLTGLEFAYGIPGSVGGAVYMNAGAYGGEMKDVLVRAHHWDPQGGAGWLEGEALELGYRHSAYHGSRRIITGAELRLAAGERDAIRERMEDYMGRRRSKQPLEYPSAGSTFKRPPGNYASALIDQCGLKGFRVGGAQVSEKHAGFVVNNSGATCSDVLGLIDHVREEVLRRTGCELECEVRLVGEQQDEN